MMPDRRCIMDFRRRQFYGAGGTGDYPQCTQQYLLAGIGDTLAKWYEAVGWLRNQKRCR